VGPSLDGEAGAWTQNVSAIHSSNRALEILWAREQVTMLEDRLRLESHLDRRATEKDHCRAGGFTISC